MKPLLRTVLLATVLALIPAAATAQRVIDLDIGTVAPDMKLETLDGKPASLAPYLGKAPIFMEVWASWCENCEALAPRILEAKKKYGNQMRFIAVAVSFNQSQQRVKLHQERHKFDLEMFYDSKGEADGVYGVKATSTIIVIDKAGRIVYAGAGADQDIEAAIRKGLGT
jgi:thiol-disulfide isomerase/thioredoxin